jgi:glycosyltransferase involved in cell wall biosynthesis
MRVLMVSAHGNDASSGGVERGLTLLAERLTAHRHEVEFLQAFPSRTPVGAWKRTVLHPTDWRDDRSRRLKNHIDDVVARPSRKLEEALAAHRPDVVHTHNLPGITTAAWEVCRRLGYPVVHTLHDYHLLCPRVTLIRRDGAPCRPSPFLCGFRVHRLARWAPNVTHVMGVSQYLLDAHAHLFPSAKLQVIRHPMSSAAPGQLAPPRPEPKVLGCIGALDRTKGVDLLLTAAPRLAALGFTLRLAGDGRLRDEVALSAAEIPNVEWEGPVVGDRKARFFETCDLGVVPSVWAEPGGPTYTVVEWLAAGRPVLVSDRGGLGEVAGVFPGTVRIAPTADSIVDALAALREREHWQGLLAAIPTFDEEAEIEQWTNRHEQIYAAVLGEPAGSRLSSGE